MDYFKINGKAYDVSVLGIEETFTIMYTENTGRVLSDGAPMMLDAIGTFFGHEVKIARKGNNSAEFDALYKLITRPRNTGLSFDIVHNQDVLNYEGYVSKGKKALQRITTNGEVIWDGLTITIAPMKAQVTIDAESNNSLW